MGAASSTNNVRTNNETNQTFTTQNTMNILNETVNSAVANALLRNNSSCSSLLDINQRITFRGCRIAGDLNLGGIRQEAIMTVDFSCVNAFKAEQNMAQTILSEIMSNISSNMDVNSENAMNTYAE